MDRVEGPYFRSSSGSVMETKFHLRDGRKQGAGRSFYIDNSAGKSYSLDHGARKETVEQKLPKLLSLPNTRPTPDQVIGEAVINGLHCVAVPIITINGDTKTPIGTVCIYLTVKRESIMGDVRHVWDLYNIQFANPDPSKLGFPSDYKVDHSKCSGCKESG